MEMTLIMNATAFASLTFDEMMEIDGGSMSAPLSWGPEHRLIPFQLYFRF